MICLIAKLIWKFFPYPNMPSEKNNPPLPHRKFDTLGVETLAQLELTLARHVNRFEQVGVLG